MSEADGEIALQAYVLKRNALGDSKGKAVFYSLLKSSADVFSWIAALEDSDFDAAPAPVCRFRIDIDRHTKEISLPVPIEIPEDDIAAAILAATGQHAALSTKFTDGALSTSYKVKVQESPDIAYVLQLRHHGLVSSMDAFMTLISRTCDPKILPTPPVYPIPGELARQKDTGMGRQITKFIPGVTAGAVYPKMPHEDKLIFVRNMALAFEACWRIQLPPDHLIGELVADLVDDRIALKIEPDRHYGLNDSFSSVRDYLRAHIRSSLAALEKPNSIKDYQDLYLDRIRYFVENNMHQIPAIVEDIPIVAIHADMGPHNVIVSADNHAEVLAIIDWEFVESAPYASLDREIEMLFRKFAANGYGIEYDHADELREAFWNAIPEWKRWQESDATQTFLEWFRFCRFMKPEYRSDDLPDDEKEVFWRHNIQAVENILKKYSESG